MKKTSTAATASDKNLHRKLTIGLDLGDRSSWYCMLDEAGEVIGEQKLGTTPRAMKEVFAEVGNQVAAPAETGTPNLHLANIAHQRFRMEGWRQC